MASIGRTSGGLPTIRSSPSTVWQSLESARRLSFVRTSTTLRLRRFICFPDVAARQALAPPETPTPPQDHDARSEPLHIPLERAGERLVEIVDAEHAPPVRR